MGFVYAVITCLVLIVILTIFGHFRIRRIASARVGDDFNSFRDSCDWFDAPPEVLQAVYAKFQNWFSSAAAFPVRAEDEIAKFYGMVGEDLDDAILEVLVECGRQLPPKDQLREMGRVVTVRDFALFVSECPQVQPSGTG